MYFIIAILIGLFLLGLNFILDKLIYQSNTQFQEKLNFYKQDIYQLEKPIIQVAERIETPPPIPSSKIIEHISSVD